MKLKLLDIYDFAIKTQTCPL